MPKKSSKSFQAFNKETFMFFSLGIVMFVGLMSAFVGSQTPQDNRIPAKTFEATPTPTPTLPPYQY